MQLRLGKGWLECLRSCAAGDLSRNRTVGLRLGKGEALDDIIASMTAVAEGVLTSRSAHLLAKKVGHGLSMAAHLA